MPEPPREYFAYKAKNLGAQWVQVWERRWFCSLSDTKPVVRVSPETGRELNLENLTAAAKRWIFE